MPVMSANIIVIALVVALWAGHLLVTLGRPLPPVALWLPSPGLPMVAAARFRMPPEPCVARRRMADVADGVALSAIGRKHLYYKLIVVSLQWLAILAVCLLAGCRMCTPG